MGTHFVEPHWLIEMKPSVSMVPAWFCGSDDPDDYYSTDVSKAVRFSRKQDAETVISMLGWSEAFASEHMWPELEELRSVK